MTLWHDKADGAQPARAPVFTEASSAMPSWAKDTNRKKRLRSTTKRVVGHRSAEFGFTEDVMSRNAAATSNNLLSPDEPFPNAELDVLLANASPMVSSKQRHGLKPPKPAATHILREGKLCDLVWHPGGEALVAANSKSVQVFHSAGRFLECLSSIPTPSTKKITHMAMVSDGESIIVLQDSFYTPTLMTLGSGQTTPLTFMDPRIGDEYVMTTGKGKHKIDNFPSLVVVRPQDTRSALFALTHGTQISLGSLRDGCVTHKLTLGEVVEDIAFRAGGNELVAAAANKIFVYDLRKTTTFLHSFVDEGSMKISRLAVHGSALIVGSSSGVVNVYVGQEVKPTKSFMNLSTSVDLLSTGMNSDKDAALLIGASQQANGLRCINLSSKTVCPEFPPPGMHHKFLQCVAYNPMFPCFTVGEANRIVNYKW